MSVNIHSKKKKDPVLEDDTLLNYMMLGGAGAFSLNGSFDMPANLQNIFMSAAASMFGWNPTTDPVAAPLTAANSNDVANPPSPPATDGVTHVGTAPAAQEPAAQESTEFNFVDEAVHKAHVLVHGVQTGIAGIISSPETIWDFFDGLLFDGRFLWGNHQTNSTFEVTTDFADKNLIQKAELRDQWDQAVDMGAQIATAFALPLGAVAGAFGASAKAINVVRAYDTVDNTVGMAQIGGMVLNPLIPG